MKFTIALALALAPATWVGPPTEPHRLSLRRSPRLFSVNRPLLSRRELLPPMSPPPDMLLQARGKAPPRYILIPPN